MYMSAAARYAPLGGSVPVCQCACILACVAALLLQVASALTVNVSNGQEFVAALADQSVGVLQLSSERGVALREEDFQALLGPRPAALRLRRNVTIRGGRPGVPSTYILYDAGGVTDRVQLADGVWLVLEALVAYRYTDVIPSQAARSSLLVPCRPGETGGVLLQDAAYLQEHACMPMPYKQTSIETAPRPLRYPGPQSGLFDISQEGCVPDSLDPQQGSVPLVDRCWAAKTLAVNYAVNAERLDRQQANKAVPEGYSILIRNCYHLCPWVLTVECVKQYGPYGCFMLKFGSQLNASQLNASQLNASQPQPPPSSSSGGSGLLGPLLGGLLGGAALLAAGLLLLVRRRSLRRSGSSSSDAGLPCPDVEKAQRAAGGASTSGSTALLEEGSGRCGGLTRRDTASSADVVRRQDSLGAASPEPAGAVAAAPAPAAHELQLEEVALWRSLLLLDTPITPQIPLTGLQLGVRLDGSSGPIAIVAPKEGAQGAQGAQGGSASPGRSEGEQQGDGGEGAHSACGEAAEQQDEDVQVQLLPESLGKGAFGAVQKGLYKGREVAVKIVAEVGWTGGHGPPSALLQSFEQEVQVLGRCRHPNVVRLLAACLTPPKLCLVMELMETSLFALMYRTDSTSLLPLDKVLHIAVEVARGLEYLHPTVMHRDLKPANVLLADALSPRPVVKLADFGLSRLRTTAASTLNPEAGTAAYVGPEAYDPENYTITHQVDIYSLGVLLWEMLSGRPPWVGQTPVAIGVALVMLKRRLPLDLIPEERCLPRVQELMAQMWDGDPRRRPAAAEVVKMLTLAQQDVAHGAQSPTPNPPARLAMPGPAPTEPTPSSPRPQPQPPASSSSASHAPEDGTPAARRQPAAAAAAAAVAAAPPPAAAPPGAPGAVPGGAAAAPAEPPAERRTCVLGQRGPLRPGSPASGCPVPPGSASGSCLGLSQDLRPEREQGLGPEREQGLGPEREREQGRGPEQEQGRGPLHGQAR